MTDKDKDRFYRAIGEAIKNSRKKSKISQAELALKINMSRASIVNIEKGRQHPPIHLLWNLSMILGVSIHELIPEFALSENEIGTFFEKIIKKNNQRGLIHQDSLENLSSFISQSQ
ncbi:MAG: helix-turn-helix transcriptional regulator [Flavobacteriaceae bacterium]